MKMNKQETIEYLCNLHYEKVNYVKEILDDFRSLFRKKIKYTNTTVLDTLAAAATKRIQEGLVNCAEEINYFDDAMLYQGYLNYKALKIIDDSADPDKYSVRLYEDWGHYLTKAGVIDNKETIKVFRGNGQDSGTFRIKCKRKDAEFTLSCDGLISQKNAKENKIDERHGGIGGFIIWPSEKGDDPENQLTLNNIKMHKGDRIDKLLHEVIFPYLKSKDDSYLNNCGQPGKDWLNTYEDCKGFCEDFQLFFDYIGSKTNDTTKNYFEELNNITPKRTEAMWEIIKS